MDEWLKPSVEEAEAGMEVTSYLPAAGPLLSERPDPGAAFLLSARAVVPGRSISLATFAPRAGGQEVQNK
jgi:coenzyme PQQ precursor peptide PqqA